ncbi:MULTISPECIES: M16 family metallopeptidase [unclassified Cellulophaga]|uniref:M16 family metallopeptidase n=1 Tax=unclassified Cellulophaga TaxID=2634405 RepID=UPI0026E1A82D|nr:MULTISPECIES: pitrilysin family protein [unclassified Cellulophaga]MDO6492311.1 pitrilysin family protein [Cellulophaga sp. 2_MG-2023]MDO6493261.1 pitrilysin family protein [Cellulophaga sp. 3_MG-2023]
MRKLQSFLAAVTVLLVISCKEKTEKTSEEIAKTEFKVDYDKFTLDNGLQVIFHIDRSDPVVAVALTSHVGSAREKVGRTGFAHLFEHLLFLESENLGKGGLDKMSARIGGSGANGSTSRDRTNYFQTVPKDALEKMIWAEADKLGYFINTVTEPVLAKEKEVVKNEKRQRVDNNPYGHVNYVQTKALYPEGHPYSWTVIGSLEDLQNATLQDVKDFYNKWYVPNNVTLTIAGDFDKNQAKEWVKKYFDEIKKGDDIPALEKQPVTLPETKKLYYEDNFARLPQLSITWPSVPEFHKDAYALDVLSSYLAYGKKAPLYKVLVEDKKLTDRVRMYNYSSELAGELTLSVTAFDTTELTSVNNAVQEAFTKFEKDGISDVDINRIKAGQETDFYNSLSSVLGKGFQLAQYEIFAGDPGYVSEDVKNILAVTKEDVMRVYNTYVKGKNFVAVSAVPKGQSSLVLEGSIKAEVVEEKIVEGKESTFDPSIAATYQKTPSSFDRSIEPPYGDSPDVKVPDVYKEELSSGIKVFGIENNEVPLVEFNFIINGGMLLEDKNKIGVSNLLASMLTKGTKNKTPEELENAIETLGATIVASASNQYIIISGNCLAKNYTKVMDLVNEIILEPRWDAKEFNLLKQSTISQLQRAQANPNSIARNEFYKVLYGADNILANNNAGTTTSVKTITLDDLKEYYNANVSPTVANFHIVGDITAANATASLETLNTKWEQKNVTVPTVIAAKTPEKSKVYFYNVPDAKQSILLFGTPAIAATDKDFYPAQVMNYRLGGGSFASQLTQELREGKGYTYGVGSSFSGGKTSGLFTVSSGVRTNVTYEASQLVKDIMKNYSKGYNQNDLEVSKGYMVKSNARAFETMGSKLNMLENISMYNYPVDYAKQREQGVKNMSVEDVKALADEYVNPDKMIYLIVGDAKTQLNKLNKLGYGEPELLNPDVILKD